MYSDDLKELDKPIDSASESSHAQNGFSNQYNKA